MSKMASPIKLCQETKPKTTSTNKKDKRCIVTLDSKESNKTELASANTTQHNTTQHGTVQDAASSTNQATLQERAGLCVNVKRGLALLQMVPDAWHGGLKHRAPKIASSLNMIGVGGGLQVRNQQLNAGTFQGGSRGDDWKWKELHHNTPPLALCQRVAQVLSVAVQQQVQQASGMHTDVMPCKGGAKFTHTHTCTHMHTHAHTCTHTSSAAACQSSSWAAERSWGTLR